MSDAEIERLRTEHNEIRAKERKRCVRIVREQLDQGEYERSLGQVIAKRILEE